MVLDPCGRPGGIACAWFCPLRYPVNHNQKGSGRVFPPLRDWRWPSNKPIPESPTPVPTARIGGRITKNYEPGSSRIGDWECIAWSVKREGKFVAAMIEVCLEQRSIGIMTGTTLSKAQRSVPEARLDRHCLEQHSTEQIGTPTITTRH